MKDAVGKGDAKGCHGYGSSALMLMIMLVALTRQNSKHVKMKALSLAVGLLKLAVANLTTTVTFAGIAYGKDARYYEKEIEVVALALWPICIFF